MDGFFKNKNPSKILATQVHKCSFSHVILALYVSNGRHLTVLEFFLNSNWKYCHFSFCNCPLTEFELGRVVFLFIMINSLKQSCVLICVS